MTYDKMTKPVAEHGVISNQSLPLQRENYQTAAEVLARALQDDPGMIGVLKGFSEEERIKALTVSFGANLQKCMPSGAPLGVNNEEEMAGAAVIHRPGMYPPPVLTQLSLFWTGFTAVWSLGVMWRWIKILTALEKNHPKEPHYYLELLGVDPPWQGLGFGSRLMQQLTSWADADGVGCYLETSKPRNVPFYQRHGFQITKEIDVIGVHLWMMWRPPGK